MMDENNKLYMSTFAANMTAYNGITTHEYLVNGIESFVALTTPLDEAVPSIYTIFKTSDNEYYTDYDFAKTGIIELSKLSNEVQAVNIETVESSSKNKNIEELASTYAKDNKLLESATEAKVYIYKLVEAGLIEADKSATSEECLGSKNNTSLGCVLGSDGKSINSNYVLVTKDGDTLKTEYKVEQ